MEWEEVRQVTIGNYTFRLLKLPNGRYRSEPLPITQAKEVEIPVVPKEQRILAKFESNSKPGDFHYVIQTPLGSIYCTCYGFRSPDKCWHYRSIMDIGSDNLKETITITNKDLDTFKKLGGKEQIGQGVGI